MSRTACVLIAVVSTTSWVGATYALAASVDEGDRLGGVLMQSLLVSAVVGVVLGFVIARGRTRDGARPGRRLEFVAALLLAIGVLSAFVSSRVAPIIDECPRTQRALAKMGAVYEIPTAVSYALVAAGVVVAVISVAWRPPNRVPADASRGEQGKT